MSKLILGSRAHVFKATKTKQMFNIRWSVLFYLDT